MSTFKLPDLGEGLQEAEIREWHVAVGDDVTEDQPLVSMETAKALVDVPAPFHGKIKKLHGNPGDIIATGAVLVSFEGAEEDAGTVVGNIEVGEGVLEEAATGVTTTKSSNSRVKATPAVRKLARSMGIDLASIKGSGPGGAITQADLETSLGGQTTAPEGFEPLQGVRRAMAISMAKAHAEVAPVTLVDDADINHFTLDTDITWRLVRAIAKACHEEPALNAHFDGKSSSRKLFDEVNLALAVDTPAGLYAPVIKNVGKMDVVNVREKINNFKQHAKNQSFPPEELQGATITLSNFGVFVGRYANPVIVPPTVAIIGVGKRRDQAVAVDGQPVVHKVLPLSLTVDHRAVTGGEAARFLAAVIADLQA